MVLEMNPLHQVSTLLIIHYLNSHNTFECSNTLDLLPAIVQEKHSWVSTFVIWQYIISLPKGRCHLLNKIVRVAVKIPQFLYCFVIGIPHSSAVCF